MPSEADLIADSINKPLMFVAAGVVALGFAMCLTFALLPLGLIVMAAGVIWAFLLYIVAVFKTRIDRVNPYEPTRPHP